MARRLFGRGIAALGVGSALLTGAVVTSSLAASSQPRFKPEKLEATRAAIFQFQRKDQRLQDVGWRLVRGNADFCPDVIPSVGLQLQDTAGYGEPDLIEAALGLNAPFTVQTSASGSPSGVSGAFASNRPIASLNGVDPNQWPIDPKKTWQRLTRAHDWIDQTLAETGAITVAFADGSQSTLEPVPVCAPRFEVLSRSKRAVSEGARVVIGERFPAFQWEEDGVFAGVVAHELAHNLLNHRDWLDRNKRKRRNVRLTEREADRLMPWLLANAGYDPMDASRFMTRWGQKHDGGLFRARTHDGWDERVEFIEAELPIIARLIEKEGEADWAVHFRREINPDQGLEVDRRNGT